MARAWQRWLSPRPLLRTNISTQTSFLTAGNAARYEVIYEPNGRWGCRETHYIDNPRVKAGMSGPPLHLHWKQDEFFRVEQGILAAIVDGKERHLTKDDGTLMIPAGSRHRFWSHPSATESLVFYAWPDPCKDVNNILDVNFLRNAVGYLSDCEREGVKPSLFQLILFYQDASSMWTPEFLSWVPNFILSGLHYVLANWVAAGLLGYVSSCVSTW
ncbi:hypothetical protein PG993_004445 [Apiospora rasikravindrae]|uniref:Cupin type-2 domain-containing protein n=1 Tax=Apiospora rasikravindrae TaxID=990691 RepID=A0ABR1TEK3_9PEZI